MINFLILFIVPLLLAVILHFLLHKRVSWLDVGIQAAIVAGFIGIALTVCYQSSITDTEVWNGKVSSKSSYHVSCSHSYDCNCYTTSDKNGNTTRHCSTCYEHDYDIDWAVKSTTGESVVISRVDRQGLNMPARWGSAYIGQPFSSTHSFVNYIQANPDSVLLGTTGDVGKYKQWIPKYPDHIYDYYQHDPVINMIPNLDASTWNWLIREDNKILGPTKQANIILILVPLADRDYVAALKDVWLGGKKNDIDIIIGSKDGHKIDFAEVMSWTTNPSFKVSLKNQILNIGTLDQRDQINYAIFNTTRDHFVRMHMKDMKYLIRAYQPSRKAMMIIFVLSILFSIAYPVIKMIATRDKNV